MFGIVWQKAFMFLKSKPYPGMNWLLCLFLFCLFLVLRKQERGTLNSMRWVDLDPGSGHKLLFICIWYSFWVPGAKKQSSCYQYGPYKHGSTSSTFAMYMLWRKQGLNQCFSIVRSRNTRSKTVSLRAHPKHNDCCWALMTGLRTY